MLNPARGGKHAGFNLDGRWINGMHFERKFRKQGKPIYRALYERGETPSTAG
jgi:hypothetical protein